LYRGESFYYICQPWQNVAEPKQMILMKRWILGIVGALCIIATAAVAPEGIDSTDWKLYKEDTGVQIYMKKQTCDDEANGLFLEYVLIKLVNTNNEPVEVSWIAHRWLDNEPAFDGNSDEENSFVFSLQANDEVEGVCAQPGLSEYKRFTRKTSTPILSDLELAELTVTLK